VPRNPFEVFGLTPDLVAELSERELHGVLKSMYRALQKTFHPDVVRGRKKKPPEGESNESRAVELNLALEALDLDRDPAGFRKMRKLYVARRPAAAYRASLMLREELKNREAREDRLAQNYLDYLALAALPAKETLESPAAAPLPARGVLLGLSDLAISNNIRQTSWTLGSNYKQISADPEGGISVKHVGRSKFSQANFIHLLGTVGADSLDLVPLLERGPTRSFKSPAPEGSRPRVPVINSLSPENFKRHVLPLIKPALVERAYLFSLNNESFHQTGQVTVEGVIIKIDRRPPAAK
jgi:hypothetical protein